MSCPGQLTACMYLLHLQATCQCLMAHPPSTSITTDHLQDEFVRIPLDDYVAKGGVSSTPNWANQTSAFVPELGRPMTFEEFR